MQAHILVVEDVDQKLPAQSVLIFHNKFQQFRVCFRLLHPYHPLKIVPRNAGFVHTLIP